MIGPPDSDSDIHKALGDLEPEVAELIMADMRRGRCTDLVNAVFKCKDHGDYIAGNVYGQQSRAQINICALLGYYPGSCRPLTLTYDLDPDL